MYTQTAERCMAFEGTRCIARGETMQVAEQVKRHLDDNPEASVLFFDDEDARIVEVDLRGSVEEVRARLEARRAAEGPRESAAGGRRAHTFTFGAPESSAPARSGEAEAVRKGPGRPKLGVVSREVTLLPRHWDWLSAQPGGASVTLRKLVEAARRENSGKDRTRRAQEITYRFMNAVGGDLPGYEEALRALYAPDAERFAALLADWPADIREHTLRFSQAAFGEQER